MNTSTYISVNEILSDVLKLVDDEAYIINSKGYYVSQIQQALEGLAFDTFFDEREQDFEFPVHTLAMPIPDNAFNIQQIFLFNGDKCSPSNVTNVYWKRNLVTFGNGYFARSNEKTGDPFYSPGGNNPDYYLTKSYEKNGPITPNNPANTRGGSFSHANACNIRNGMIIFSPSCRGFERVMIYFHGTGCAIGDVPAIPIFFREAVKDYVTEVSLRIRMAKEPQSHWAGLWKIYDRKLNKDEQYGPFQGTWYKAQKMVKTMNSKMREDLKEYLSRFNH